MKKKPQVNRPMKGFPSYALTKDATPDEIRAAADGFITGFDCVENV